MDDCGTWDSGYTIDGYQPEIINGVTVYYGGDSCDSEESDWEDPEDVARRELVDDYNFDLLEGMEPMVFAPSGNPSRSDRRDEYVNYIYDGNDARVSDDDSIVDSEENAWREYCASIFRKRLGPFSSDAAVSPPMGVRKDELLSDESDWEDPYIMLQVSDMWTITILTCLMEWT